MASHQQPNADYLKTKVKKACTSVPQKKKKLVKIEDLLKSYPGMYGPVYRHINNAIASLLNDTDGRGVQGALNLLQHLCMSDLPNAKEIWNEHEERVKALKTIQNIDWMGTDSSFGIRKKAKEVEHGILSFRASMAQATRDSYSTVAAAAVGAHSLSEESSLPVAKCRTCSDKLDFQLTDVSLTCGHNFCRKCLGDHFALLMTRRNSIMSCPFHEQTIINPDLVLNILRGNGLAQYKRLLKEEEQQILVPCPKCKQRASYNPAEPLMAECRRCDFTFCTNCSRGYHGVLECEEQTEMDKTSELMEVDGCDISGPIPSAGEVPAVASISPRVSVVKLHPASSRAWNTSDALAKSYEQTYYEPSAEMDTYSASDISSAFDRGQSEDHAWPWNKLPRKLSHSIPTAYKSLLPGRWVDDEVLEAAMKQLVAQSQYEANVCVLESYLVKWGVKRSYEDGVLSKIVQDKELMKKSSLLALMNTDLNGGGGHWILGIVDLRGQTIFLLDTSLVISKAYYHKFFFSLLHVIHVAYQMENKKLQPSLWKLVVSLDCVQQHNAVDCGPLVVANAYGFLQKRQLQKTPESGPLRQWIYETAMAKEAGAVSLPSTNTATPEVEPNAREMDKFEPQGLKIVFEDTQGTEAVFPNLIELT